MSEMELRTDFNFSTATVSGVVHFPAGHVSGVTVRRSVYEPD